MSLHDSARSHRGVINELSTLRIFVTVVETESFTEAGRRLNIVPSTVSKHISALEAQLKIQLIVRSTQRLSVTELGHQFYGRCINILNEVEQAEAEVGAYRAEPQGTLRISVAPILAIRHLMPLIERFLSAHPKVSIELNVTATSEDLIAAGVDVAIRISNNLDPNLIAVKLAPNERVYCASPEYLEIHGRPDSVEDLVNRNCLIVNNANQSEYWPMRQADGTMVAVRVSGNFKSSNADAVRHAILAGLGVGYVARFVVDNHLSAGELVELFPDQRVVASNIYAVFPMRQIMPLKTRLFIDFLKAEFHKNFPWG
jgi:DNA-binding transcriptional LysR family regulator